MTSDMFVPALAVVLSLAVKVATFDQIRINRRTGTAGFSWRREATNAASYGAWVWLGWETGNVALIAAQGVGVVLSVVLLGQVAADRGVWRRPPEVVPDDVL